MAAKKKTKTAKKPVNKAKPAKKAPVKTARVKSGKAAKVKAKPAKKAPVKAVKKAPARKTAKAKPTASRKASKAPAAKPKPKAKVAKAKAAPVSSKPIIRTGPSITPRPASSLIPVMGRVPAAKTKPVKAKPLTAKDLNVYKDLLLKLRDRVIDEISFLANDNLNRSAKESSGDLSSYSFHMADQGTDNYDREFAASLLNSEHDVLYEIEEALRRIEQGTYGVCEISGNPIERERLKVLPFARYCVAVQSEIERGKPRYRPFRRTSIQGADSNGGM